MTDSSLAATNRIVVGLSDSAILIYLHYDFRTAHAVMAVLTRRIKRIARGKLTDRINWQFFVIVVVYHTFPVFTAFLFLAVACILLLCGMYYIGVPECTT